LLSTAEQALACPACRVAMANQTIGGVVVGECPQCNGLWVPGESFNDLIERARTAAAARPPDAATGLGVVNPKPRRRHPSRHATGVVYRRCPVCKSPMHRKNFGQASGVIVDWCGPHGTWLDADELGEIGDFVLSGRFAAATAKAAKAQAEAAERARAQALSTVARHSPAPPVLFADRTLLEHLIWGRGKSRSGRRSSTSLTAILKDLLRS
jgi:Zn-finger nucleic acid-binding protein